MRKLALTIVLLAPALHAQEELFHIQAPGAGYGRRLALDEGLVAVTTNAGRVHLHVAETGEYLMQLTGSDNDPSFGGVVALGDGYLVVGAGYHSESEGRVYVFDVATGTELYQLAPPSGPNDDLFGWAVATDGGRILVGAPDNDDFALDAGSAYLYDAASGQLLHQFQQSVAQAYQFFGVEVALDGDYALVGANWEDGTGPNQGAAYLFDANTGQEIRRFEAVVPDDYNYFGSALDVEPPFVVIGSPIANPKVHVFDLSGAQLFVLTNPGQYNSRFGDAIDIDGTRAIVGAEQDDSIDGRAYVIDLLTGAVEYTLESSYPTGGYSAFMGSGVGLEGTLAYAGAPGSGTAHAFNLEDVGQSYCAATPNSTGHPATLYVAGSESVAAHDLELLATNAPPSQPAVFFVGTTMVQLPFGDGVRCAGGSVTRLGAPLFELAGQFETTVDFSGAGAVLTAGQWFFQCWYRDPLAGGAGFNLSDGVSLLLAP